MNIRKSVLLIAVLLLPALAFSQVISNVQSVNLSVNVGESITFGPPSSPVVTYTYTPGSTTAPATPSSFTLPLSWNLLAGHTGVKILSWVANNGTAGLTAPGTPGIPSSNFFEGTTDIAGNFNNALSPCNGGNSGVIPPGVTGFVAAGGCTTSSLSITTTGNVYSDTVTVTTSLQNLSPSLAAATYTGTLFFQAVTF